MKLFKQIIIVLIFGIITLFNVRLYSSNSNNKNYIQHQKEAKSKKRKYPLKQKKRRIKKLKKNQTAAEQEPIRHLKQINKKIPALNRDFL